MNRKKIIIVAVCVIILGILGAIVVNNGLFDPYQNQIKLGYKLLGEGKYEEAILAFNGAIEIDKKKDEAYIGLAETYIIQNNENAIENAIAALMLGFEQSENNDEEELFIRLTEEILRDNERSDIFELFKITLEATDDDQINEDGKKLSDEPLKVTTLQAPTASIPDGTYESGQTVELNTNNEGVEIYFTLDGSKPSNTTTKYMGEIKLPIGDVVLNVVGYSSDGIYSDVVTFSYVVNLTPNAQAHKAYYDILVDYSKRLGICYSNINDGMTKVNGVSYASLIDFDGDGIDELYLHWFESDKVGYDINDPILTEEVWGFSNGVAKKDYSEEHSSQDQHVSMGSNRDIYVKNGRSYLYDSFAYTTGAGDFNVADFW